MKKLKFTTYTRGQCVAKQLVLALDSSHIAA